jgi:hypothetical protein
MLAHQESLVVLISIQPLRFNMILQAKVAMAFSSAASLERARQNPRRSVDHPIQSIGIRRPDW